MNASVSFKYLMNETPLLDNRLLILEDDKAIAELLLDQAEDRGLIGFIAANKEQFRETYLRLKPSVLILDIVLGDEDVTSVVDFLKKYPDRVTHLHIKDRKRGTLANDGANVVFGEGDTPVSYTHLTLPTKRIV